MRGRGAVGYGLIVRDRGSGSRDGSAPSGDFYAFEVGDLGQVGVWRREGDQWVELLPTASSPAVRPGGEPNVLAVHALGPRLDFLVNGVLVATVADPDPGPGAVGLYAGGAGNEAVVEQLLIQAPE